MSMAQSPTIIVKIGGFNQIRRWTAKVDQLAFQALHKRVSEMFNTNSFSLTYKDDEDDDITLGCDDELGEAITYALKSEPAVLRLKLIDQAVPVSSSAPIKSTPPSRSQPSSSPPSPPAGTQRCAPNDSQNNENMGSFFQNLAKQLPVLIDRLPPEISNFVKECELDVAASNAAKKAAKKAASAASTGYQAAASGASAGFNAGFNATTQTAANGFNAAARAAASAASAASRASETANAAANAARQAAVEADPRVEGIHPGVTCDKTNANPIVGTRYNLIGHDYDLCEAEFNKLPDDLKPLYKAIPPRVFRRKIIVGCGNKGVHHGVTCDKSGMSPIVGMRYHLPGHDYDLCEKEYEKLPEDEKKRFKAIPPPSHSNQGHTWRRNSGQGQGPGRCGAWQNTERCAWNGRGWRGGQNNCQNAQNNGQNDGQVRNFEMSHGEESDASKPNKPAARFISDVSIHDGTQMSPGTPFTKIWRLKNSGDVPWWPGSKLAFVGGDQLNADNSVALPASSPIQPGQEVDIAVDMQAPQDPGRYVGYWRLTGPMGRRKFGQRVWVHMHVVPDSDDSTRIPSDDEMSKLNPAVKLQRGDEADEDDGEFNNPALPTFDVTPMDTTDSSQSRGDTSDKIEAKAPDPSAKGPSPVKLIVFTAKPTASDKADKDPAPLQESASSAELHAPTPAPAPAAPAPKAPVAPPTPSPEEIKALALKALTELDFDDVQLAATVVEKHTGADGSVDLAKCVTELTALADLEWDTMLDDLAEMGFEDRNLNKKLLVEHSGSLKQTVKKLVQKPQVLD